MPRASACASALLVALGCCASTSAEDGTLRLRESALNSFAAAVQPLTIRRSFAFRLWVPNPFLGGFPTPVDFNCEATASVTNVTFHITPALATVQGNVTGKICNIDYQSSLATGITTSVTDSSLVVTTTPTQLRPSVKVLGLFTVTAPFTVDAAPALTVAIPLAGQIDVDTTAGPRSIVLVGQNLQLTRKNGSLEIKGDALLR